MLRVNGTGRTVTVEPRTTLADALRDRLGLHGTHLGCEHGVCGSCTVLLDGAPVHRPDVPGTIMEFQERFATEAACLEYLAGSCWPDGFARPACGRRGYSRERLHSTLTAPKQPA